MWSSIPACDGEVVPSSRSKHASVLHGQFVYLLGGRNANVPLKDFWRYNIADNEWQALSAAGAAPGCLQEHSMVGYRDALYIFGGEVGFSNATETPLWIYEIKENRWRKFSAPRGVSTPKGRRSHTATVFQDSMYIYGGYQDLKGSTSELWAFHFDTETWHLVSQGGSFEGPPPRHKHSAVLHDNALWVFGGMTDLIERSDFWRFDFVSRRWRPVKSKPGPGCLHSHCSVKFLSVMMLFGGERDGQTLNEMWRFHFATEFWEKLTFMSGQRPTARAQTTAFIFSQFRTRGAVHYMGLPEQDYFGCTPEPSHVDKVAVVPKRDSPVECAAKKYTFAQADTCLAEEQLELLRRPSQQLQRLPEAAAGSIMRDLAKLSQFNLTRLSQYCSYSMFSNESTESLNTTSSTASPCSVRMARSRSSQQLLNMALQESASTSSSLEGLKSPLPRDPISVPNFKALMQKQASLEEEEVRAHRIIPDLVQEALSSPKVGDADKASRSDSAYTFQSYDCSSRSSTLSSNESTASSASSSARMSKSSSINRGFTVSSGDSRLVDVEEEEHGSLPSPTGSTSTMGFSNPHYLASDVEAMLERKRQVHSHLLLRDDSHRSFAQALSSPADSLFSDYQDFHARLNQDFVEMGSVRPQQSADDKSCAARNGGSRPRSVVYESSAGCPAGSVSDRRTGFSAKVRPLSADISPADLERQRVLASSSEAKDDNHLMLLMYVLGGREVGHVTVFKRPISIWRLDLTKTF